MRMLLVSTNITKISTSNMLICVNTNCSLLTCPHDIARVVDELRSDLTETLQTTMHGNMQLADSGRLLASDGDVQVSRGIHAGSTVGAVLIE